MRTHRPRQPPARAARILRGLLTGLDWRAMSALDEPQGVVFRVRGTEVVRLDP